MRGALYPRSATKMHCRRGRVLDNCPQLGLPSGLPGRFRVLRGGFRVLDRRHVPHQQARGLERERLDAARSAKCFPRC